MHMIAANPAEISIHMPEIAVCLGNKAISGDTEMETQIPTETGLTMTS